MNKLILFSIVMGSYIFAGIQGNGGDNANNQSKVEKYSFVVDTSDDNFKTEARRRGGKGNRGRRKGGSGLR